MDRITGVTLRISLLIASLWSLLSLAKMPVEHILPMRYYWRAAVGFLGATPALSAAIRLRERPAV